jgi:hypothetical protein
MREIQCPSCKGPLESKKGDRLLMGLFTSGLHPMVVKCFRCTSSFKMYPADFAKMPEVNVLK